MFFKNFAEVLELMQGSSLYFNQDTSEKHWMWLCLAFWALGFAPLAILTFYLGAFNTEEDRQMEEQEIDRKDEHKYFTLAFEEEKLYSYYMERNMWRHSRHTRDMETMVDWEVDMAQGAYAEQYEFPVTNYLSNNLWIIPPNEYYAHAVDSHLYFFNHEKSLQWAKLIRIHGARSVMSRSNALAKLHFAYSRSCNSNYYLNIVNLFFLKPFSRSFFIKRRVKKGKAIPRPKLIKPNYPWPRLKNQAFFFDSGLSLGSRIY